MAPVASLSTGFFFATPDLSFLKEPIGMFRSSKKVVHHNYQMLNQILYRGVFEIGRAIS